MKFVVDKGPYLKDKDFTSKIMKKLFIALIPIIIFAVYKNGIIPYQNGYITFYEALRPLFMIMIGGITAVIAEMLYVSLILKKREKDFFSYIKHSYALFPGLFLALILPINTPLWLVILGSLVATVLGKMLFGGFGYNIFNPALIGYLFVSSSYGQLIAARGGYLNGQELDSISKATPLTNISNIAFVGSWNEIGAEFGSLSDYFFGFIPGSLGETSTFLILIALIYLIITKVVKWRIPIIYITTVLIMTFIIGTYNGMELWFPLFQLLSGGLMFGAVFIATDPVTSPITKTGQTIYALGLGILTVVFRFLTPYPEGVMTAILSMNLLVIIIDRIGAKAKFSIKKTLLPVSIMIVTLFLISFYIGHHISPREVVDTRVNIVNVEKIEDKITYVATVRAFVGLIKAELILEKDAIIEINIIEQNESYWQDIVNHDYINTLIKRQESIEEVNTIAGVTVTADALKLLVIRVLEDYEERK